MRPLFCTKRVRGTCTVQNKTLRTLHYTTLFGIDIYIYIYIGRLDWGVWELYSMGYTFIYYAVFSNSNSNSNSNSSTVQYSTVEAKLTHPAITSHHSFMNFLKKWMS